MTTKPIPPTTLQLQYKYHRLLTSSNNINLPPKLQNSLINTTETVVKQPTTKKEADRVQIIINVENHTGYESSDVSGGMIEIDRPNHSIILKDPNKGSSSVPTKTFPVDSIFTDDTPLMDICTSTLCDAIKTVTNGENSSIICLKSGGNNTTHDNQKVSPSIMLGDDKSTVSMGIIPTAICWFYKFVSLARTNSTTDRYSIRISVSEIASGSHHDLCADLNQSDNNAGSSGDTPTSPNSDKNPSLFATSSQSRSPPNCTGHINNNCTELRAVTADKAIYFLDQALSRRHSTKDNNQPSGSHLFVTLHLYQYHLKNNDGISGGRSKLHLIELDAASLLPQSVFEQPVPLSEQSNPEEPLSQWDLSRIILSIWNERVLTTTSSSPSSNCMITSYTSNSSSSSSTSSTNSQYLDIVLVYRLLKSSVYMPISSSTRFMNTICQSFLIFNVSPVENQYLQILYMTQLASKLYRTRIKRHALSLSDSLNAQKQRKSPDKLRNNNSQLSNDSFTLRRNSKRISSSSQANNESSINSEINSSARSSRPRSSIMLSDLEGCGGCITSSSEISLDTVIYRGSDRKRSLQQQDIGYSSRKLNEEGRSSSARRTINEKEKHGRTMSSLTRENSTRMQHSTDHNHEKHKLLTPVLQRKESQKPHKSTTKATCPSTSHLRRKGAWPKVAMKKASQVMKSGQELWVDGPEAFCQADSGCEMSKNNSADIPATQNTDPIAIKAEEMYPSANEENSKDSTNPYKAVGVVHSKQKNEFVSEWLNKQPNISMSRTDDITSTQNISKNQYLKTNPINKSINQNHNTIFDFDHAANNRQDILMQCPYIDIINYSPTKHNKLQQQQQQPQLQQPLSLDTSSSNFSRIEEWIKSVSLDSPSKNSNTNPTQAQHPIDSAINTVNPIMTQSMYSPPATPFHTSHLSSNDTKPNHTNSGSKPHHYVNKKLNKTKVCNYYPSLPMNINSPRHTSSQLCDSTLIYNGHIKIQEIKRAGKDCKKKDNKKGLGFLNQFIRNKKIRKDQISTNPTATVIVDKQALKKTQDSSCIIETNEYAEKAGPPLNLSIYSNPTHQSFNYSCSSGGTSHYNNSSYSSFKISDNRGANQNKRTDSSGHGSDCSSLKTAHLTLPVTKTTNLISSNDSAHTIPSSTTTTTTTSSTTITIATTGSGTSSGTSTTTNNNGTPHSTNGVTGFKYVLCRRAGSSGYESIVRGDSELSSSHNDSASESSVPIPTQQQQKVSSSCSTITQPQTNSFNIIEQATPLHTQKQFNHRTATSDNVPSILNDQNSTQDKSQLQEKDTPTKNNIESFHVEQLIEQEKLNSILLEREELKSDLIHILKYFSTDIDSAKIELDRQLDELEGNIDNMSSQTVSLETMQSTNNTLRSVLNRYQFNLCLVTSFTNKDNSTL